MKNLTITNLLYIVETTTNESLALQAMQEVLRRRAAIKNYVRSVI